MPGFDDSADIGLIGLAVMGQNLALNLADHGFKVAVYNRTSSKTDDFLAGEAGTKSIKGPSSLADFVSALAKPRKILVMVKAGQPVDDVISQLSPLIEAGDLIIDGGNSHYTDTERRLKSLSENNNLYIGCGISGGEEGARHGPSIMPGGMAEAWPMVKDILQSIAAKAPDGTPCCDWVGPGGAGHYVKMVHNGIEYGDMQLIGEAYWLLRNLAGYKPDQLAAIFADWNKAELESYLIEITAMILAYQDGDGQPLIDKILDTTGQKGTGRWTVESATELGLPLTLIAEAMFARSLSALKAERTKAARVLSGPLPAPLDDPGSLVDKVKQALYCSKIVSYAQGYMLLQAASDEFGWQLNLGNISLLWRAGCVIRSRFLGDIKAAYQSQPDLSNILLADFFIKATEQGQTSWRQVVADAAQVGLPLPAIAAGLSFYDGYRSGNLPANLLQAQRDVFGAHTYERIDQPRGQFFHTNWTGHGGEASSGSYNV